MAALTSDCVPARARSVGWLSLYELLHLSDEDRARQDIAGVNSVCAEGLLGVEYIDHAFFLRRRDAWAGTARLYTERLLPRVLLQPNQEFAFGRVSGNTLPEEHA